MLHDPFQHKRPKIENCESCRFYMPTPKGEHGNCHRLPPSNPSGHITVYPLGWCGEYEPDPQKIEAFGKEHFAARKDQAEQMSKQFNDKSKALQGK